MSQMNPSRGKVVVKSDTTFYNFDSLWIGVTGNVTIEGTDGVVFELTNVPVGILDVRGRKVMDATVATGIVALIG